MILENYTGRHPAIAIEVNGSDLRREMWWDELNGDSYITIETPDDGTPQCQSYLINDNGFVLADDRRYLLILMPSMFSTGEHICYIVNA